MSCYPRAADKHSLKYRQLHNDLQMDVRRAAESFWSAQLDDRTGTHIPQHDHERTTFMDPKLYRTAATGDINAFKKLVEDTEGSPFSQESPRRNTVLHLAILASHDGLVKEILKSCPDLVKCVNNKGDLAIHVAANGGHLSTVQSLVAASRNLVGSSTSRNCEAEELKTVNKEGNTALHVALKNRHQEVALFLYKADPRVSHNRNKEDKSPLCIATEAGYLELVKLMMTVETPVRGNSCPDEKLNGKSVLMPDETVRRDDDPYEKLKGKSSLLHTAIIGRNREVLDEIWRNDSAQVNSTDEEGRTPLSLAAYLGYFDGVCYLLDKSTDVTYLRDRNGSGSFPIHMASSRGHMEIVQEFLKRCPDSRELLNQQGENILHVAAKFGKANLVKYMLETPELEMLINERDGAGNTPLHSAAKHWHPKVVSILTWDKRVSLELVNNDGLTAIDMTEKYIGEKPPFRKQLTYMALKSANAPRSEYSGTKEENQKTDQLWPTHQYTQRVNTLLLVSTLVATVTFAAGFTVPGGYNNSDPHLGMATLVKKHAFHAFLISNTIAMYSSVTVSVALIWAQLGDLNLILTAVKFALPFLGVALSMMSIAFMSGVYLVVSNLIWLGNIVLIMGSIFLVVLSVLFVPLYLPIFSNHYIGRYIFYYYFCLMMLATKSDAEHK